MQRAIPHRLLPVARSATALLAAIAAPAFASTSGVVISRVYGGTGGTYASDQVELFNAGSTAVTRRRRVGRSKAAAPAAGSRSIAMPIPKVPGISSSAP
jgi:hypothetical protein